VVDVGTAASVRVAVSASEASAVVGALWPDSVGVTDAVVGAAVAPLAGDLGRAVVREALPAAAPAFPVLAGRLVVVRDVARLLLVLDVVARGRAGGRTAGGLPAPNAHPSTVPLFGRVEAAPTVLYDQDPPGLACQYDQ
jgi:hypothetical protein